MSTESKLTPVERIFERLAATYGAAWDRSIGQSPIRDVMTVWEHELSGFLQSRKAMMAIAWALENLLERCPNAIEFKNLCRRAPLIQDVALPAPAAEPSRVAAEFAKFATFRNPAKVDDKAWADRIIDSHASGHKVSVGVLRMAKSARRATSS